MAFIPLTNTVTVTRATGELDIYGKPIAKRDFTLKCRAIEGTHLAINRSGSAAGATIVSDLKILLDGLADITYEDFITYTNELGTVYNNRPKSIRVQKDFGGKPILTEVML